MKYQEFRKLWAIVEPSGYEKFLSYEYKKISGIYEGKKRTLVLLHMFGVSILSDPRFDLIFYTPADRETDEHCHRLMKPPKKQSGYS